MRKSIYPNTRISSDQNCYRASISLSKLQADLEVAPLISTFDFWMGPQHLVIAAPSSDEDQYSMALYHPGNTGTAGDWKKSGDLDHMREAFQIFRAGNEECLRSCRQQYRVEIRRGASSSLVDK